jgi:phage-related protein
MVKFIGAIAAAVPKLIAGGVNAILAFFTGLAQQIPKVANKGVELVSKLLEGISKALVRIVNKGADAVINFLNGIAEAIRTKGPELRAAGYNIADAIIDGMWDGIHELGQKVVDKLGELIHLLPKAARKILGIQSPSKVFEEIGKNTMAGLTYGLASGGEGAVSAVTDTTDKMTDAAATGLSKVPTFLSKVTDINPTITPVLDLSRISEDAPKIGSLIQDGANVIKLSDKTVASESTNVARGLSFAMASSDPWGVGVGDKGNQPTPVIHFEQHNTSPKALSPAEIYRLTHNQLASAKGRLFGKADNIR